MDLETIIHGITFLVAFGILYVSFFEDSM